jgi:hypothetical protein
MARSGPGRGRCICASGLMADVLAPTHRVPPWPSSALAARSGRPALWCRPAPHTPGVPGLSSCHRLPLTFEGPLLAGCPGARPATSQKCLLSSRSRASESRPAGRLRRHLYLRPRLGHTIGLCHGRGAEQRVRGACLDGGVPGRAWAVAAGTSDLLRACRAGVPASGGRSRLQARLPGERSCPRQPPARGATAVGCVRARLLATRSRSPLPTIPRCGWHRLPPRAASAPVTAAPAAPATAAGLPVPGESRHCLP